jgi:hypothetical protein
MLGDICHETVNGWLWYCDEHDTHGNADSMAEAEHMADAHSEFWEDQTTCVVAIWERRPPISDHATGPAMDIDALVHGPKGHNVGPGD